MNYKKLALLACVGGALLSLDVKADSVHCPSYGTINHNLNPGSTFSDQGLTWTNTSNYKAPEPGQPPILPVKLSAKVSMWPDAYGHIQCGYIEQKRILTVTTNLPRTGKRYGTQLMMESVQRQDCTGNPDQCSVTYNYGTRM